MVRKIIAYNGAVRSIKKSSSIIQNSQIFEIYKSICGEMNISRPPALAQNKQIASPMLVGAIRPVIVLPNMDLNDAEIRYIFRHELTHYKRRDIVYKWAMQFTLCLHWFNPFVYWINREVNRNCELSCDEAVIKQLDEKSKYAYGDMLLDTISMNKKQKNPVVSITLNEDTKLIKERLSAIMKYTKKKKGVLLLSVLLAAILVFGAGCAGVYSSNSAKQTTPTPDISTPAVANNTEPAPEVPTSAINTDKDNQNETALISSVEADDMEFWQHTTELPYRENAGTLTQYKNFSRGAYDLSAQESYALEVSWHEGGTLTMYCLGQNGYQEEYLIEDGVPTIVTVPEDGLYYIFAPLSGDSITECKYSFSIGNQ